MEKEVDERWNRFKESLSQHLKTVPCKPSAPLDKYYDAATKVLKTAEKYEEKDNQRSTYMFYYRFASLCIHTIASHPRYHDPLFREEKRWAIEETKKAMVELESIKATMKESWKADLMDRERRAAERAAEEQRKKREMERREKEKDNVIKTPIVPTPSKTDSSYLDAMRSLNIGSNLYPVKNNTSEVDLPIPKTKTPADAAASSSKRNSGIYPVLEEPSKIKKTEHHLPSSSKSSLYPSLDELSSSKQTPKPPPSYDKVVKKEPALPPPSYDELSSKTTTKNKPTSSTKVFSVRIPPNTRPGQLLQVRDPQTGKLFKVPVPRNHRCYPGDVIQVRIPSSKSESSLSQQQYTPAPTLTPRRQTTTTTTPQKPSTGTYHSPKEILDAPRGFSLLSSYNTHPIRSTRNGFQQQSLISSACPLNVLSISKYQFLPEKALLTRVRKELSRKRHGKDGYFYYALGPPYGNRIIDIKLAREMSMVFQARVMKDQVQHERQFFKYHLSRGVKTPRGLSPLGRSHFEYLYNILSMNPKSRVIAKVTCPLRAHLRKPDERVEYNLETQNLSTLVHERWLDNFAMDCLMADMNRRLLRKGQVFLPTMFQTLVEIHADNDISDMVRNAVDAVAKVQGRSRNQVAIMNIFVPYLQGECHWALGIVSFERGRLEYFDSLQYDPSSSTANCIARAAREFRANLPRSYPSCGNHVVNRSREWNGGHKQGVVKGRSVISSGSCGSVALQAAYSIATSKSLSWGYEDMPYYRLNQMLSLVSKEYLTRSAVISTS